MKSPYYVASYSLAKILIPISMEETLFAVSSLTLVSSKVRVGGRTFCDQRPQSAEMTAAAKSRARKYLSDDSDGDSSPEHNIEEETISAYMQSVLNARPIMMQETRIYQFSNRIVREKLEQQLGDLFSLLLAYEDETTADDDTLSINIVWGLIIYQGLEKLLVDMQSFLQLFSLLQTNWKAEIGLFSLHFQNYVTKLFANCRYAKHQIHRDWSTSGNN